MFNNIVSPSRIKQLQDARDAIEAARAELGEDEGPLFTTKAPNVPHGIGPASPWFQSKDGPRNRVKKRLFEPEEIIRDKSKRRRPDLATILPVQKPEQLDLESMLETLKAVLYEIETAEGGNSFKQPRKLK